jgi:hypothetical protein
VEHEVHARRERGRRALGVGARQGLHAHVVRHEEAVEADVVADRANRGGGRGRGGMGVERVHDDVRRHAKGEVRERAKGGEVALQVVAWGVHAGQRAVGVHAGAAVAGQVLEDRQHAAREEPVRAGARSRDDGGHVRAVEAVEEHGVGALLHEVGERRAVDVDPRGVELMGDEAVADPLRAERVPRARHLVERGQELAPMGRAQALHAAPLLVHEDGRVAAHEGRAGRP